MSTFAVLATPNRRRLNEQATRMLSSKLPVPVSLPKNCD